MTEELLQHIEKELDKLPYGNKPASLYDPIRYIISLGGKRLRPILLVLSGRIFSDDEDNNLHNLGAVAEVFHNFSLMHDDIMDNAPLRRGKATVHEKWNANTAILSGDVMLVLAYQLLAKLPQDKLPFCLEAFNQVAREVCEGQQLDMEFEQLKTVSIDDYLDMIRLKTAVLLGFCCKTGAYLGGANSEDTKQLYQFGEQIGVGFQLMDDYLDVFGDSAKVGKRVGGDIVSNKKTYLLIQALHLAEGDDLQQLNFWLTVNDEHKFDEKIKFVTALYQKLGVDVAIRQLADSYFNAAFQCLHTLSVKNEAIDTLSQFARLLMMRDK